MRVVSIACSNWGNSRLKKMPFWSRPYMEALIAFFSIMPKVLPPPRAPP